MGEYLLKQLKLLSTNKNDSLNYNIANYILNNLDEINNLNTNELAKKCYTSSTSIIRFCQKLGLEGLNEFKFKLKHSTKITPTSTLQLNVDENINDHENLIIEEYLKIKMESTENLHNNFFSKNWNPLINEILEANNVFVFAFNLAYNISRNFVQRLRWLNKNVIHENDMNSIDSYIPMANKKSCFIFITLSGESELISNIVDQVNLHTYTFGIIGKQTNLTKKLNDFFIINSRENDIWDIFSIRSQAVMQLLDYLYIKIINKNI